MHHYGRLDQDNEHLPGRVYSSLGSRIFHALHYHLFGFLAQLDNRCHVDEVRGAGQAAGDRR